MNWSASNCCQQPSMKRPSISFHDFLSREYQSHLGEKLRNKKGRIENYLRMTSLIVAFCNRDKPVYWKEIIKDGFRRLTLLL